MEEHMKNEFLFNIAEDFIKKNNIGHRKWNFMTFWYGDYIPDSHLDSARKWFAGYQLEIEKPLILVSDNCIGAITEGFLVTNIKVYYRLKKSFIKPTEKGFIWLEDINSIDIDSKYIGAWLMINGKKEALLSSFSKKIENEVKPIREILQIFIKEIQLRKE
jgi:hypothetical protein